MDTTTFRSTLDRIQLSQGALSRLLKWLGDPAEPLTILRRVERWAQGVARVPGEMVALLNVLQRCPAVIEEFKAWDAQ